MWGWNEIATILIPSALLSNLMCELNIPQGPDPREIICTVIRPSPDGEIVWMIGDEVQTNNNPVETNDYGDWQQSFNLVPTVGIDDKRFRCLLVQCSIIHMHQIYFSIMQPYFRVESCHFFFHFQKVRRA